MANWKTIRIFISSTFRDMFAERDHLVRVVFPELKERCRKKRVHLIDVDLRWGVTEKDAQEGKALDICLDEIDSCRPYFLGLLGQRYGFIPDNHHHSITAQEIFHGVLHNDLPTQIVDLRSIIECKLEGKRLSNEQTNVLVHCYLWDANKRKYALRPDISTDEEDIIRSVFAQYSAYQRDRSFFFFRKESLTVDLAGDKIEDFFDEEEADCVKLAELKQSIVDEGLPCFEYNSIEAFGQNVLETLWKRIDAEVETVELQKDWLKEEAEFHELFAADRTRRFVGRRAVLEKMHVFCRGDRPVAQGNIMVITGEPGCGKSALMGRFSEGVMKNHADWLIIPHFVGASPGSTSLRQTLRRFCGLLNQSLGITDEVPEDIKELLKLFPELLTKAAEQRRVLVIIDAVNQLEKTDNAHNMNWLPQDLGVNVKVIISTLQGAAYDALMRRSNKPDVETIKGLLDPEIKEYVNGYLREVNKKFPNLKVADSFFDKVKSGNPLYIQVALEELRVFGQFEKVAERVNALPDDISALFDQVLQRIEGDFSPALVKDCMSYIACGRYGMTAEELQTLLKEHAPKIDEEAVETKLPDMLWARLYRAFSAYLFERSGVIDFFHGQLKKAVAMRYLKDEDARKGFHMDISRYLEDRWQEPYVRALSELVYQQIRGEMWGETKAILCSLHFIEAKTKADMTYELIEDYNMLIDAQPLLINEDEHINAFYRFINFEGHNLIKFGKLQGFSLLQHAYNVIEDGPVRQAANIAISEMSTNNTLLRIPLKGHSNHPRPILKTLEGHFRDITAVAVIKNGKRAISASLDHTLRLWDIETGRCLHVLKIDSPLFDASAVAVTSDGETAISLNPHGMLNVWNVENGQLLNTNSQVWNFLTTLAITPDGRRAIVGSNLLKKVFIWDVGKDNPPSFEVQHSSTDAVAITTDGRLGAIADGNNLLFLDLNKRKIVAMFDDHTADIDCLRISHDDQRVFSGSADGTLRIWSIAEQKCLNIVNCESGWMLFVLAQDDKMAISCHGDNKLRLWDIDQGNCVKVLQCHYARITSLAITDDGHIAISGCDDNSVIVWNLNGEDNTGMAPSVTKTLKPQLALRGEGREIVSLGMAQPSKIHIWDSATGLCNKSIDAHELTIPKFKMTLDGRYAVSIGNKPDGYDDEFMKKPVGASLQTVIYVVDLETGRQIHALEGHSGFVYDIAITADDTRVISASSDRSLRSWDIEKGLCLRNFEKHNYDVTSVALSSDGRIAVSSDGRTIYCWDIYGGNCINKINMSDLGHVGHFLITPDNKLIVAAIDNVLRIYNFTSGHEIMTIEGDGEDIDKLSLSPDGRSVIYADIKGVICAWSIKHGDCLTKFQSHTGNLSIFLLSEDGRIVITAVQKDTDNDSLVFIQEISKDNTVRLWDLATAECLVLGIELDYLSSVVINNNHVVVSDLLGHISFYELRRQNVGIASITPVRTFHHKTGTWDEDITATCVFCNHRFIIAENVCNIIADLSESASLSEENSPILELTDESWDNSKLLTQCPHCSKPLRFNPFIVDNKERFTELGTQNPEVGMRADARSAEHEIRNLEQGSNISGSEMNNRFENSAPHSLKKISFASRVPLGKADEEYSRAASCPYCGNTGWELRLDFRNVRFHLILLIGASLLPFLSHWWLFLSVPVALFASIGFILPFTRIVYRCQICGKMFIAIGKHRIP